MRHLGNIFLAVSLFFTTCLAGAQENNSGVTRYLVTTDRVKPEMLPVWMELQKDEVVPALKASGVPSRKVYHTVLGENYEYVSYRPFPDYGEMDGPDALERALGKTGADELKKRLNDCLYGSYSRLENSRDEFFIDPGNAPVLFTSSYRASPGRSGDYMIFLRDYLQPPIQRAVDVDFITGYQVMVTDQGGETGLFILNMFYPDFDTLDMGSPAAHMMNAEQLAEFFQAGAGLISPLGQIIREFEAEISF